MSNLHQNLILAIICVLFISPSFVLAQESPPDNAVLNPFAFDSSSSRANSFIIRKYDPFDNRTFFTSAYGARVYENKEAFINLFPMIFSNGDINGFKPDSFFQLFLIGHSKTEGQGKIKITNSEIVFLIDGDRHSMKINESNFIRFPNFDLYEKLYSADKVRARIQAQNSYYEIDMSKSTRNIIKRFIKALKSLE